MCAARPRPASLAALVGAGIPVFKLQEAAALWVEELIPAVLPELRAFTETIYLSQSVLRRDGDARHFLTTRSSVQDALRLHRATPLSDHLEIETYTWDVLPAHLKSGDVVDYVSREIEFVRAELTA